MEDMRHACDGARTHMLRRVPKQPSLSALYTLSSHATHEAVHLLCQMLVFDPVSSWLIVIAFVMMTLPMLCVGQENIGNRRSRPSVSWRRTLTLPLVYVHVLSDDFGGMRQYTADFEPAATLPFDDLWERKLTSVQQVKGKTLIRHCKTAVFNSLFSQRKCTNSSPSSCRPAECRCASTRNLRLSKVSRGESKASSFSSRKFLLSFAVVLSSRPKKKFTKEFLLVNQIKIIN